MNLLAGRDEAGEIVAEDPEGGPGCEQSRSEAEETDEEALGEELADETSFGGAERAANGELTAAAIGAGQHEAGEIGAGDEPDDGNGGVEGIEAGADVIGGDVPQRFDADGF